MTCPGKYDHILMKWEWPFLVYLVRKHNDPFINVWDITPQRILWFEWLNTFCVITWEQEFCQTWGLGSYFSFLIPNKDNDKLKKKNELGPFPPKFGNTRVPPTKSLVHFLAITAILTLSKTSEKANKPFLRETSSTRMDGQPDNNETIGRFD